MIYHESNEWEEWGKYFAVLFPTAGANYLNEMTERMYRTFGPTAPKKRMMTDEEYMERLTQMALRLRLPPDPHNKLMGG